MNDDKKKHEFPHCCDAFSCFTRKMSFLSVLKVRHPNKLQTSIELINLIQTCPKYEINDRPKRGVR